MRVAAPPRDVDLSAKLCVCFRETQWVRSLLFLCIWGPFYQHGLTLIPIWISNYIQYKVWDEITYPFPNFNGANIGIWEWIH